MKQYIAPSSCWMPCCSTGVTSYTIESEMRTNTCTRCCPFHIVSHTRKYSPTYMQPSHRRGAPYAMRATACATQLSTVIQRVKCDTVVKTSRSLQPLGSNSAGTVPVLCHVANRRDGNTRLNRKGGQIVYTVMVGMGADLGYHISGKCAPTTSCVRDGS